MRTIIQPDHVDILIGIVTGLLALIILMATIIVGNKKVFYRP